LYVFGIPYLPMKEGEVASNIPLEIADIIFQSNNVA
jgi:hypothetical protein